MPDNERIRAPWWLKPANKNVAARDAFRRGEPGGARGAGTMTTPNPAPPQQIYLLRHGEKPADPPRFRLLSLRRRGRQSGVDVDGNRNVHSLLPRGWQRSGALAVLFDPAVGPPPAGLRTPTALYSPSYGKVSATQAHRPFQTIQGLGQRLGVVIRSPLPVGQEPALVATILAGGGEVVMVCWEHHHIPALAQAIPTVNAASIPTGWPDDRFDVVWAFTLDRPTGRYVFGQVPQQLLPGDTDTVI